MPLILNKGSEWYAAIGTEKSKGTNIFSLVGKVVNTGLVEVPMGITLREIVEDIGGGIPDGRQFKAIQTGGPSGGCIPESLLDMEVDFDSLTQAGSMMGSGGMIVMNDRTCMVDVARYFVNFLIDESCGKCTPCREGVKQLQEVIGNIADGRGNKDQLQLLKRMGDAMNDTCFCALGKTAAAPMLTVMKHFPAPWKGTSKSNPKQPEIRER